MRKILSLFLAVLLVSVSFGAVMAQDDSIVVGSKDFTEQRFLGYVMLEALAANGYDVVDEVDLGGTAIARGALEAGEIDVYANYTGTATLQSLPNLGIELPPGISRTRYEQYAEVASLDAAYNDLIWMRPAPANNTYTGAVTREFSEENGITSWADMAEYVNAGNQVRLIANEEFVSREDGLPAIEETYGFEIPREDIESLPGGVTAQPQQQLRAQSDSYEMAVAFGTDGTIATFDLVSLEDPQGGSAVYQPTPVFRGEVVRANPEIPSIINPIFAIMTTSTLQQWNNYASEGVTPEGEDASIRELARMFLIENGFIDE